MDKETMSTETDFKWSEKEKRYKEILEKKEAKKKISVEDRIFLAKMELEKLNKLKIVEEKKFKTAWINKINRIVNTELSKIYTQENKDELDLIISAVLLHSLNNYEEISKKIKIEDYVIKSEKSGKLARVKIEEDSIEEKGE